MNPADYGMLWMGQFTQERMILDDNSMLSVGMSVMDDINHQSHSMDMNPILGIVSEYTAATAPGPIAITPEIYPISSQHQLDPQQHTILDQYRLVDGNDNDDEDDDNNQNDENNENKLSIHQEQQSLQHLQLHHLHHHVSGVGGGVSVGVGVGVGSGGCDDIDDDDEDHNENTGIGGCDDENAHVIFSNSNSMDHHLNDMDEDEDETHNDNNQHHHSHHNRLIRQQQQQQQHQQQGLHHQHQHQHRQLLHNIKDEDDENDNDEIQPKTTSNDIYSSNFDDSDPENSNNGSYVQKTTVATQINKKIKPVKRPGLVLKTPIAYQPCLDPSVIPIQRDGMAVCERCGAIGVKHSFYTKERRFCSMSCARNELERLSYSTFSSTSSPAATTAASLATTTIGTIGGNKYKQQMPHHNHHQHHQHQEYNSNNIATGIDNDENNEHTNNLQLNNSNSTYRFKIVPQTNEQFDNGNGNGCNNLYKDLLPQEELPQIPKGRRLPSPCPQDEKILTVRRRPSEFYNSYDWNQKLSNPNFFAAEVTCFSHAPGYEMWSNIGVGMKVEVENTDCDNQGIQGQTPYSFWVATVLRICGYKALIRYEGFELDSSHDFWVNLCSSEVHPVGWCATRGKPLIPPRTIENKFSDWKEFLVKHLSGARTLPSTFYNKISDSFKSRFRVGLQLEVVDKNRISQMKLATVQKIVGKRLFVKYYDAPPDDNGFWCHEDSPLIHPVGWASTVGHNLAAPIEYLERMQAGHDQIIEATDDDSLLDLFKMNFSFEEYYLNDKTSGFMEGMKIEAVDPLNLSSICVATVMAVLKFGYMMIRIDSYDPDANGSDWFCYHEKSPCIFPTGFCNDNGIVLTPPRGYENGPFDWQQYLINTESIAADSNLFSREIPSHGFQVGMKLECADLMDPRLVCVATIAKIVGRLLKVHFDGWEDEYDQWLDCESPDMYPVGWCILVGHKLEGPRVLPKVTATAKVSPKVTSKRKRKKKPKLENVLVGKTINPNIQTRNVTVKKDKEIFDQKRHTSEINLNKSRLSGGVATTSNKSIKQELKMETNDGDDDDLDEDGYSFTGSDNTTPSLPPITPEFPFKANTSSNVRTVTPNLPIEAPKVQLSSAISSKIIPRLSDAPFELNLNTLSPNSWSTDDVAQFLRVNDCTVHCDAFIRQNIDGERMLKLTKDEIITMLGMKVGPSLKIFDLIQQLKCKLKPQQSRTPKTQMNNSFL